MQLTIVDKEKILRILANLGKLDNNISVFDILTDDVLSMIFINLDCKSILLMCKLSKRLNNFCTSGNLTPILGTKLNRNLKGFNLEEMGYACALPDILFTLNKLGQVYHTGFGFDWDAEIIGEPFTDENFDKLLDNAFENDDAVVDYYSGDIIIDRSELPVGEEIHIIYHPDKSKIESMMTIPFKTVVIKFTRSDYWRQKPEEWYNSPLT